MDPQQRQAAFDNAIGPFLEAQEDALWLFQNVRERVKGGFPELQLSQRTTADSDLNLRTTNDNAQLEGNLWRDLRVTPSPHL
jgi:hypothetical protein